MEAMFTKDTMVANGRKRDMISSSFWAVMSGH